MVNELVNQQGNDAGLRELELFAGAGGGILSSIMLGHRTVCAVEYNAYARSVLLARQNDGTFPPFPVWDEVRTFDGKPWRGLVDVVSGGFPCQDISVAGGGAMDSTASEADYGQKCSVLLARFDPVSCELKTVQCSLIEDLTGYSLTLPRWGSMRNGACYLRAEPAHLISENESGLLPTPCASMSKGSSVGALVRKSGRSRARDRLDHAIMALDGGHPNPEFVEWMMGWPIGLTDLKPLATARLAEWRQQHSIFFPEDEVTA